MKMNLYNDEVIKYKNKKILNGRSRMLKYSYLIYKFIKLINNVLINDKEKLLNK